MYTTPLSVPPISAVVIRQPEGREQKPVATFETIELEALPDHEVLVKVHFSTVNYKDGLALTGGRIARRFPMVAGIDLAGEVVHSKSSTFKPGDRVMATGWGLSETQWGGYATYQRLKAEWLIRVPEHLSLEGAMSIGTAGLTSMLCLMALEEGHCMPGAGEVLVTGAAGGVGSFAVSLLARAGYDVVAVTGRLSTHGYLKQLGASQVLDRAEFDGAPAAFGKERFAAAIDCVGGNTLANVLSQIRYGGCVAACGLAGGTDLPGSVFPFILRAVRLQGVDSVMATQARRVAAWDRLAASTTPELLRTVSTVVPFAHVLEVAKRVVGGEIQGRVVVQMPTD